MNKSKKGFSIRIFLPDGYSDGLRIVEKSNWTGRGVVCPRFLFPEAKLRDEFNKTGIYILIGPAESGDVPKIYIGEGDPVRPRIEQHFAKKDFWTSLFFFTSKDENLNKAHIQYIESHLLQLAKKANRCELDNNNQPVPPSLSEMDSADCEGFLDEMLLCFPILGLTIFEMPDNKVSSKEKLYITAKGISATGYESPNGFVVQKDSEAVIKQTNSIHLYMSELRKSLLERGIFNQEGEKFILTQDYSFNSPSTAAGVMLGRAANGRTEWHDKSGRTLKSIQEQQIQ